MENLALSPIHNHVQKQGNFGQYKTFDRLYTDIVLSESGYIGIYYPYIPASSNAPKGFAGFVRSFGNQPREEQLESFEVLHLSQINDFDLDIDGKENTTITTDRSGKRGTVDTDITVNRIDLIIDTKDFCNPRKVVTLYNGDFTLFYDSYTVNNESAASMGFLAAKKVLDDKYKFTPKPKFPKPLSPEQKARFEEHKALYEKYNNGKLSMEIIDELLASLKQMLAAYNEKPEGNVKPQKLDDIADKLKKYKDLLDSGAITQEEFDMMKKQLLGL